MVQAKTSGCPCVGYYTRQNDFIGPGYSAVDIIFLGSEKKPNAISCFEFQSDTLFIYDIKCLEQNIDGDGLDLEKGTLKHKILSRKR